MNEPVKDYEEYNIAEHFPPIKHRGVDGIRRKQEEYLRMHLHSGAYDVLMFMHFIREMIRAGKRRRNDPS